MWGSRGINYATVANVIGRSVSISSPVSVNTVPTSARIPCRCDSRDRLKKRVVTRKYIHRRPINWNSRFMHHKQAKFVVKAKRRGLWWQMNEEASVVTAEDHGRRGSHHSEERRVLGALLRGHDRCFFLDELATKQTMFSKFPRRQLLTGPHT